MHQCAGIKASSDVSYTKKKKKTCKQTNPLHGSVKVPKAKTNIFHERVTSSHCSISGKSHAEMDSILMSHH